MMSRVTMLCFALLFGAGCGENDDDNGGGGGGGSNSFTATVDGEAFRPPRGGANGVELPSLDFISVSGIVQSMNATLYSEISCQISVDIPIMAGGTYPISSFDLTMPGPQIVCSYTRPSPVPQSTSDEFMDDVAFSDDGTMTITVYDPQAKRIEGTFAFTTQAFDDGTTSDITDGAFALTYLNAEE